MTHRYGTSSGFEHNAIRVTQSTSPTTTPITPEDVKEHLRIDGSAEDTLLDTYIRVATREAENWKGYRRQFINATWTWKMDSFGGTTQDLYCPVPPLSGGTSTTTITYVDTSGTTATLSTTKYIVDTTDPRGRISPSFDNEWPETRNQREAVTITFQAGYGTTQSSVPATIRHGIKMLVGGMYEVREDGMTNMSQHWMRAADSLLMDGNLPSVP